MRKILTLATVLALAGCGGGGGGSAPVPNPVSTTPITTSSQLVTPTFVIVVAPKGTSSAGTRKPNFVSSASASINITITNPPAGLKPTSVSSNINGASCTPASPCVVNGPPSPPGQTDNYTITTYDGALDINNNPTGNALDTASVSFTPVIGTNNQINVTLNGIPFTVTIAALVAQGVDTAGQTQPVVVTVKDHSGQTITGTYANPVTITDPDPATYGASIKGTSLSGTHVGSCTTSCVTMQTDTDTATLTYNGLAEDPVTLTSTTTGVTGGNAGTATFTPTLQPIAWVSGPTSFAAGSPKGVDLYTTDNTSSNGYTGSETYNEPGYTDAPYNKVLTTINGTSCAAFASLSAANSSNNTVFTATATSNTAGQCTRVVSDGLLAAGHGSGGPSFVVTYTTSGFNNSAKQRRQ